LFGIVNQDFGKRPDARTARTYRALSAALVDLMQTREFDAITVQDLLDRTGVGRATFYAHFRNKDDFLLTDLERMLAALPSRALNHRRLTSIRRDGDGTGEMVAGPGDVLLRARHGRPVPRARVARAGGTPPGTTSWWVMAGASSALRRTLQPQSAQSLAVCS
jgi:AcrR family transcriptional regulator